MKDKCRAKFYQIPCYYYPKDQSIEGQGAISEFFLQFFLHLHSIMIFIMSIFIDYEPSFPVKINIEDLEK